MKFIPETRRAH